MATFKQDPFLSDLDLWSRTDTQVLLQKVVRLIRKRAPKGVDINGNPYKPYSAKYARWKGQTNVDLTLSGRMLRTLKTKTSVYAEGWIYSETPYAAVINFAREFFGLSAQEEQDLVAWAEQRIAANIARLGG